MHNVLTGKKFNNFKFEYNSSERSSRWPELLVVKRARIGLGQRSIYYEGAKFFNIIIPTDVKHTQNANIFKKQLTLWLLQDDNINKIIATDTIY